MPQIAILDIQTIRNTSDCPKRPYELIKGVKQGDKRQSEFEKIFREAVQEVKNESRDNRRRPYWGKTT